MKCRVEYISTFHIDLQSIQEFLVDFPIKVARIINKTDDALLNLVEMPEMYPVYQMTPEFRFIVIEDYLVFYKYRKNERLIEVHRLLYGGMDIPSHMQS
jgi:plasmid stabilization system protein ParE